MTELFFNILTVPNIRLKQVRRGLFRLGIFRLLVLLIIFAFAIISIYNFSETESKAYVIGSLWILIIASIHLKRKDKIFLHINFKHNRLIYCVEYTTLSVPLFVCFSLLQQWVIVGFIFLFISAIGFLETTWRRRHKTTNTRLQQYIPYNMYEWKAGVRKYFYLFVIVWIIGLTTSFIVVSVPIALFIIGFSVCGFYETNESWQMLISCRKNAKKFLLHKLKRHAVLFGSIVLPLLAAFIVFHHDYWYILVIEFVVILSVHIYGIVLKYAFYSHERAGIVYAYLITGILIGLNPPTTPVLWLASRYFFHKARINLNFYLHDFN